MNDRDRHVEQVQRWLQECSQVDLKNADELEKFGQRLINDSELLPSLYVALENVSFHEQVSTGQTSRWCDSPLQICSCSNSLTTASP
jgi:hypothetical protein